jgi:ribonuclease Z
MSLVGREKPLHIYGPPDLEEVLFNVLKPQFEKPPFPLIFHKLEQNRSSVIFEDKVMSVTAFSLKHSVPVWGFKFEEKARPRKILAEKIEEYSISIPEINQIKEGHDLIRADKTISNYELTTAPLSPRSYVFMTDTLLSRKYLDLIKGVQLLYHEATFLHEDIGLARKTLHTTAQQAAKFASEANVQELVLGHFSTRYKSDDLFLQEAKHFFENSRLAFDGQHISWPNNNEEHFQFKSIGSDQKI